MACAELAGLPAITGLYTIGQLPKLFGFSTDANGLINEARAFVNGITSGEAVGAAVAIGVFSLVVILALGRWLPKVPGVLIAVVVAIVASSAFNLADHGVSLVGTLPKGVPPLTVPSPVSDLSLLVAGALGIALVALTGTISTVSSFAARTGQEIDGNGEMIGIGAANVAAGFFQGFPVSTSGSRTAVAEQAGAKAQLTRIVEAPPKPHARRGRDRRLAVAGRPASNLRLWHQRRIEFLLWVGPLRPRSSCQESIAAAPWTISSTSSQVAPALETRSSASCTGAHAS